MSMGTRPHPARHLFSKGGISLASLVVVLLFLMAALGSQLLVQSGQLAAVVSATLVSLTNEDRERQNLAELSANPTLEAAAKLKADDMAAKGYFSHVSPDGTEPWHWFRLAGYEYQHAGENLAVNFSDSDKVEEAWMESPKHRANILSGKYTEIGVATAVGEYKGKKAVFVVQFFGTPKKAVAAAAIAPEPAAPLDPAPIAEAPIASPQPDVLGSESAAPVVAAAPAAPNPVERSLVSPQALLHALYLACAAVVLVALALATRMEFQKHHTPHFAAASFLLVLMGGLTIVADYFVFTKPILG